MVPLTTEPPETLHLLSLMVRERLHRALATAAGQRRAARLSGTVALVVGGMTTRLRFRDGEVHLDQGPPETADARGTGTLAAFTAVCQGRVGPIEIVRGHIRVTGRTWLMLRTLPLLQAAAR